jgi:ArsR family transcriptional regulator
MGSKNCYPETIATEKQVRKAARDCSLVFTALGDPNRQDILIMLEIEGPLNVLQITEKLNLARPTVSHHLKILSNAGLLTSTKKSREIYYELEWSDASRNLKKFMKLLWDC